MALHNSRINFKTLFILTKYSRISDFTDFTDFTIFLFLHLFPWNHTSYLETFELRSTFCFCFYAKHVFSVTCVCFVLILTYQGQDSVVKTWRAKVDIETWEFRADDNSVKCLDQSDFSPLVGLVGLRSDWSDRLEAKTVREGKVREGASRAKFNLSRDLRKTK